MQSSMATIQTGMKIPQKPKLELPPGSAIALLGIHPKKSKLAYHGDIISIFIAVLFTTAKTWNQPRWPLTHKWMKKMYVYTRSFDSAMKKWNYVVCREVDGTREYHERRESIGQRGPMERRRKGKEDNEGSSKYSDVHVGKCACTMLYSS